MADTFHARLVNGPFEDPTLYIRFRYKSRAFLFDLGSIDSLGLRELHKITHVFVSHTHIDHFVGFDHLLRCSLNREEEICLFGPRGIIENIKGKLAGYTWNLIHNYPLMISVHEVDGTVRRVVRFHAANRFEPEDGGVADFAGVVLEDPTFVVRAAILDHGIPCLAFALEEKIRLNIRQERLQEMGLKSGPWLDELKKMLREKVADSTRLQVPRTEGEPLERSLKEWRETLVIETEGQKIAYVVDSLFSPGNIERIVSLAQEADLFFCEAAFARDDEARARERYHLTADQAGTLARMARVKRLVPFHFSLRYEGDPNRLEAEALEKFSAGSAALAAVHEDL